MLWETRNQINVALATANNLLLFLCFPLSYYALHYVMMKGQLVIH